MWEHGLDSTFNEVAGIIIARRREAAQAAAVSCESTFAALVRPGTTGSTGLMMHKTCMISPKMSCIEMV